MGKNTEKHGGPIGPSAHSPMLRQGRICSPRAAHLHAASRQIRTTVGWWGRLHLTFGDSANQTWDTTVGGDWNMTGLWFSKYVGNVIYNRNWRTPSFQRGWYTTNQDIKLEYNEHISDIWLKYQEKNISKPTNMGSKQQKWAGYSEDIKWRMGLHAKLV